MLKQRSGVVAEVSCPQSALINLGGRVGQSGDQSASAELSSGPIL